MLGSTNGKHPFPPPPSQLPGLYAWIYEQYRILPNETVKAWAVRGRGAVRGGGRYGGEGGTGERGRAGYRGNIKGAGHGRKGGTGNVRYMGKSLSSPAAPVFLLALRQQCPPSLSRRTRCLALERRGNVYRTHVQLNFPCESHPLHSEGPLAPLILLLYIYSTTQTTLKV